MMVVDNVFELGDVVYIKTDTEQKPRMVTCLLVKPIGITYELSCGEAVSIHYDIELSLVRNIILATTE
jgi:hypothetical protein